MEGTTSCNVPGCKDQAVDGRGYCGNHTWLIPASQRTTAELLKSYEEELDSRWSPMIPFLSASPRGDLTIPPDWLGERIADSRVAHEALNGVLQTLGRRRIPRGNAQALEVEVQQVITRHLGRLTEILQSGGELRRFSSSPQSWASNCGRAGLAVVKDGKVLWSAVTLMN